MKLMALMIAAQGSAAGAATDNIWIVIVGSITAIIVAALGVHKTQKIDQRVHANTTSLEVAKAESVTRKELNEFRTAMTYALTEQQSQLSAAVDREMKCTRRVHRLELALVRAGVDVPVHNDDDN